LRVDSGDLVPGGNERFQSGDGELRGAEKNYLH
jgi:hypothetical protein